MVWLNKCRMDVEWVKTDPGQKSADLRTYYVTEVTPKHRKVGNLRGAAHIDVNVGGLAPNHRAKGHCPGSEEVRVWQSGGLGDGLGERVPGEPSHLPVAIAHKAC